MRRRWQLVPFVLLSACFETGVPGDRLAAREAPCDGCESPPTCPFGELCAEDTEGLRFAPPRIRACSPTDPFGTLFVPMPPLAVGGTMTLGVSTFLRPDTERGAVVAIADDPRVIVRDFAVDATTRRATLVVQGASSGRTSVSIRRVEGDLLIDRVSLSLGPATSVRVVAPGVFGCLRPTQVLLRAVEVPPVALVTSAAGAVLVDQSAQVLNEVGEPLVAPIAEGLDRVSLEVVAGGTLTPVEMDVVDHADRIERASAARELLVDQRARATEWFRCFRAVHEDREVVGASFEFEASFRGSDRRSRIRPIEGAPQCVRAQDVSTYATLHVRAAGAELEEAPN